MPTDDRLSVPKAGKVADCGSAACFLDIIGRLEVEVHGLKQQRSKLWGMVVSLMAKGAHWAAKSPSANYAKLSAEYQAKRKWLRRLHKEFDKRYGRTHETDQHHSPT